MNKEDKELLLQDLCARLPYGVKVKFAIPTLLVSVRNDRDGIKVITESTYSEHIYNIEDIKPYLRPMSSMTEEEKNEYLNTFKKSIIGTDEEDGRVWTVDSIDWLNAHHFDYCLLIERGLALKAPEGMYKTE